jgi:hypothetical protein
MTRLTFRFDDLRKQTSFNPTYLALPIAHRYPRHDVTVGVLADGGTLYRRETCPTTSATSRRSIAASTEKVHEFEFRPTRQHRSRSVCVRHCAFTRESKSGSDEAGRCQYRRRIYRKASLAGWKGKSLDKSTHRTRNTWPCSLDNIESSKWKDRPLSFFASECDCSKGWDWQVRWRFGSRRRGKGGGHGGICQDTRDAERVSQLPPSSAAS